VLKEQFLSYFMTFSSCWDRVSARQARLIVVGRNLRGGDETLYACV